MNFLTAHGHVPASPRKYSDDARRDIGDEMEKRRVSYERQVPKASERRASAEVRIRGKARVVLMHLCEVSKHDLPATLS